MMYELGSKTPNPSGEVLAQSHLFSWLRIVAKTHKTLKEHFLIKQNRTKHANFRGNALCQATYNTTENS